MKLLFCSVLALSSVRRTRSLSPAFACKESWAPPENSFNGKTRLDTVGHPHSDAMHVGQRLTRLDAQRVKMGITVEDPKTYRPGKHPHFCSIPSGQNPVSSCEENNRENDKQLSVLNDALDELAQGDPRKARVVELRYFGGLNVQDTTAVLKVSAETVTRDWRLARCWLLLQVGGADGSGASGLARGFVR